MRRLVFLFCVAASVGLAIPPDLDLALKNFRSEVPKGWSFTQTTEAEGKSTVERCDAAKPEWERWSLVQKNGRAPTADEQKDYAEGRSRRSRAGTAPKITDQLDYTTLEVVSDSAERTQYRFRVRPGESRDKTAPFLRATLTVHKPTHTIETVELTNASEFSPTLGVKITTLQTLMTYYLPTDELPSFPQKVVTRVRGTAFWFKSLDADMTVMFSDFVKAGKK